MVLEGYRKRFGYGCHFECEKIKADRSQGYGVERLFRPLLRSPATDRPAARVPVHAEPLLVPARESLQFQPVEDDGCLAMSVPETDFPSFLPIGHFPSIFQPSQLEKSSASRLDPLVPFTTSAPLHEKSS